MKNIKTKKTVQDYIRLAERGHSNKAIANYWKLPRTSVATLQANATRKGLI